MQNCEKERKYVKYVILTHVAFGASGSSEKFQQNVQKPIFLIEHENTNRMVVWLASGVSAILAEKNE